MLERRSEPQIIPSLRDGLVLHALQAINCLDFGELSRVATIIQSLRDARGYHSITPTRRHADTPTRPHAHTPSRRFAYRQYLSIAAAIAFARFSRAPGCTMRAASPGLVKKPHSPSTAGNRFLRQTNHPPRRPPRSQLP